MRTHIAIAVFFLLVIGISIVPIVQAAKLHGKIYNLELEELNDVVVYVDSEPVQRYVSKDGSYSFNLNPGNYMLTANYTTQSGTEYGTKDNVTIDEQGDYVYDLFLFPELEVEEDGVLQDQELIDVTEGLSDNLVKKQTNWTAIILSVSGLVIIVIFALILRFRRHRKKPETIVEVTHAVKKQGTEHQKSIEQSLDPDLNHLIECIKNECGRTTQKEIRKHIPLSEAKISLMVSELEHKGIIQKLKKGRGNILILKKK